MKKSRILVAVLCFALLVLLTMAAGPDAQASPVKAPKRIKAVMVGDRLVDVALALGVIPEGMSVRASFWSRAVELRLASQILGCPNCVVKKKPNAVPGFMKKRGISRLILERSTKFCLYMKDVMPENVTPLVRDVPGITIEYVDFTKGVPEAIVQAGKLFGAEEKAREVAEKYAKDMKSVEATLPAKGLGRNVLILNGTYFADRGKPFVRVEAPGGYTDQYILEPLGCTNAAAPLVSESTKVSKGHFNGGRLSDLATANPDVIVATGDAFAVQLALRDALERKPELAKVPAVRNGRIYALPFYSDASVLEYPAIFKQWSTALNR